MRYGFILSSVLLVLAFSAGAEGVPSVAPDVPADRACSNLGPGEGVVVEVDGNVPWDEWEYWQNCDGTFENAYCWYCWVHEDPFYSAFAEGFHGPAEVRGMRVYVTQAGCWQGEGQDIFVWGSGIEGPGCVLAMIPNVPLLNVPHWPDVGANDCEIEASVGPRFYVGANGVWPYDLCLCPWYNAVDEDGPGGNPWTCIHPDCPNWDGEGWTQMWEYPGMEAVRSVGIGVYVEGTASVDEFPEDRQPAESATWGRVKALFLE